MQIQKENCLLEMEDIAQFCHRKYASFSSCLSSHPPPCRNENPSVDASLRKACMLSCSALLVSPGCWLWHPGSQATSETGAEG